MVDATTNAQRMAFVKATGGCSTALYKSHGAATNQTPPLPRGGGAKRRRGIVFAKGKNEAQGILFCDRQLQKQENPPRHRYTSRSISYR